MGYLSARQLTTAYHDGYCHLIVPDITAASGYRSYKFKITDILAASQLIAEKDLANGYPGLDSTGKINPIQLPAIAITNTYVVASQAGMLALTVTVGTVAVRTDNSKSYILKTEPSSILANWIELQGVTGVASFNGRTGSVSPQNADYTANQITETATRVYVTPALLQKLIDLSSTPTDTNAFHIAAGGEISALTDIGTIADASVFLAEKTSVFNKVKVTWALIKSTLKTYFDSLYATISHTHTGVYEPIKGSNDNYVTGVEKANIANLSGVNSGNQYADGNTILGSGSFADPFYVNGSSYETLANKRTSFQATPDDSHYPSEKLVKDSLSALQFNVTNPILVSSIITLNCDGKQSEMFEPKRDANNIPFQGDFTFAFLNASFCKLISIIVELNTTIVITFPSDVQCSNPSTIGTWDSPTHTLSLGIILTMSKVEFQLIRYSLTSNWILKVGEVSESGTIPLADAATDGKTYGRKDATWSEIVASGGDITKVGTGQTYTTLGDAVAAGKKMIQIVSNTTELANIALPQGTYIFSLAGRNTYSVNMGNFQFTTSIGCKLEDFTISFAYNAAKPLFVGTRTESDPPLRVENVKIINQSTVVSACIAYCGNFHNIDTSLPNYNYTGFGSSSTGFKGILDTIIIVGGGANCGYVINSIEAYLIKDITIRATVSTANTIIVGCCDGLFCAETIEVICAGSLANVNMTQSYMSSYIGIVITNEDVFISDCILGGNITGNISNTRAKFTNCIFTNTPSALNANENDFSFVNCTFNSNVTISASADIMSFVNCFFVGYLIISANKCRINGCTVYQYVTVNGDNNILDSNTIGTSNTSDTITFSAGADNNICIGNQTDVAIVNNGTGNQLAYNVVF